MVRGLITALRTLTTIPVSGKDACNFAASLPWFPAVGAFLGCIVYSIGYGASWCTHNSWHEVVAVCMVIAGIALTRGMHVDGLADWADAFWNPHDKQRTLAIMKDTHIGVFGVIAVTCMLFAQWLACNRMAAQGIMDGIISAYIVSRTMQVELAASLPYARQHGTAAPFVLGAKPYHRIIAAGCAAVLLVVLYGLKGILLLLCGWLMTLQLGAWSKKRIGGVTGDILGACSVINETVILMVCAGTGIQFR